MLSPSFTCTGLCSRAVDFLTGDFFLGLLVALLAGWGAVVIQERSAAKRERTAQMRHETEATKARLMDHVTELVKWYQVNIRLLRQEPDDRSATDLNLAHSSFIAHAKLLGIEPELKEDAKALMELARSMSQLWPKNLKRASREAGLAKIYQDFAQVLDDVVAHVKSIGSADE